MGVRSSRAPDYKGKSQLLPLAGRRTPEPAHFLAEAQILQTLKRLIFGDPLATLREDIERQRLLAEARAIRATEDLFDIVDPREPYFDDDGSWLPIGGEFVPRNADNRGRGEVLPVYLTEQGLKQIRDRSRELCAFSGHAINAKENRVSYTIGKGLTYKLVPRQTPPDDWEGEMPDRETVQAWCKAGQAVIDAAIAANDVAGKEQETVIRGDEDGEALLRLFHVGAGRTEMRFVEPEHLRSPEGGMLSDLNLGVETRPGDVEDVLRYWIIERPESTWTPEPVDASEVVHMKLNVRSTSKRGYPTFWPVRDHLERADKLLRNMSILATVRTTFAAIVKQKHTKSSIQGQVANQTEKTLTDPVTGAARKFARRAPGGVVYTDGMTEYDFPGANLSAAEYIQIYEAELRAIASRLNMPEYMLTANAANNNYASILVSESPSSRTFERLQAGLFTFWGDGCYNPKRPGVMWRVLRNSIDYGTLPEHVLRWCQIQVSGPVVVVKDKYKETDRASTLAEKGLLSERTWSGLEALDYDQEQSNRLAESEQKRASRERDEKTDKPALLDLQKAVYAGQIPREAAIATARLVFSYSREDAEELFPQVALPTSLGATK